MATFSFTYQKFNAITELEAIQQELITKANEAATTAYAPYSKFNVGCAVLLDKDKIIVGSNIENASYPVGLCAERNALAHAISNYPSDKILQIAISYLSNKNDSDPISPCGMCRQFILECQQKNGNPIQVLLHAPNGKTIVIKDANDLLPFGFTGVFL